MLRLDKPTIPGNVLPELQIRWTPMIRSHRAIRGNRGFTLVELLITVVIIAILTAIAIPAYINVVANAQDSAAQQNLSSAVAAEDLYTTTQGTAGLYTDKTGLTTAGLINFSEPNKVQIASGNGCFVAAVLSATGKVFYATNQNRIPTTTNPGTGCATLTPFSNAAVLAIGYSNTSFNRAIVSETLAPTTSGGSGGNVYSTTDSLPAGVTLSSATGVFTGPSSWQLTFSSVSANNDQNCAIATDGRLFCWGQNSTGGLGDGTLTNRATPTLVGGTGLLGGKLVKSVGVGYDHACAVNTVGAVYCWGRNDYGQLGNGTTSAAIVGSLPAAVNVTGVLAGKAIVSVSSNISITCALSDAGVGYCWGRGNFGSLGSGSFTDSSAPVAIVMTGSLAGKTIKTLVSGGLTSCAIASDNLAYCWGYNYYGSLGVGTSAGGSTSTPGPVSTAGALNGKTIVSISSGFFSVCAVASDQKAYCWGHNDYGQLGLGNGTDQSLPTAVVTTGVLAGKNITQISAGQYHTCAVDTAGLGYCWGNNSNGQLGEPAINNSTSPIAINTASGALAGRSIGTIVAQEGRQTSALDTLGNLSEFGYITGNGNNGTAKAVSTAGTSKDFNIPITVTVTSGSQSTPVTVQLTTR
jgi:prepilin-type N-terminal cleavage/methylation domain-containing protein